MSTWLFVMMECLFFMAHPVINSVRFGTMTTRHFACLCSIKNAGLGPTWIQNFSWLLKKRKRQHFGCTNWTKTGLFHFSFILINTGGVYGHYKNMAYLEYLMTSAPCCWNSISEKKNDRNWSWAWREYNEVNIYFIIYCNLTNIFALQLLINFQFFAFALILLFLK